MATVASAASPPSSASVEPILSSEPFVASGSSSLAAAPENAPTSSTGNPQLQAAEASLTRGAGPAGGTPATCQSSPQSPGSVDCSIPASPSSISADSPAAPGLTPAYNLGWAVLGVPQSRGYINYAMTWDVADGYVLLFGGSNTSGTYQGDTWTYSSGVWTELHPLVSPQGRDSSGIAYSNWDAAVLLFGGYVPGAGGYSNDTWLFHGGVWTEMHVNGPSPRWGFGLTWDPTAVLPFGVGGDVLFGGSSAQCPHNLCNDTWIWAADGWTKWKGSVAPPARSGPSMTYDAADKNDILFGGSGGSSCLRGGYCNDTWEFNWTDGWVQVGTPTPCGNAATGPCPAGDAPPSRWEASFAYDPADGYAVLFGGHNSTIDMMGDTWKFVAGTGWSRLSPSIDPGARFGAALTFDPSPGDGYLFLFGGDETYAVTPDLLYDYLAGSWHILTPPTSVDPPAREYGMMAYDVADGYVLYFGGFNNLTSAYSDQTWKFSGGVWSELTPALSPPPTFAGAMAYDPYGGYVMLFGGWTNSGLSNETWGYQAGNWFVVCATLCSGFYPPSGRAYTSIAYDPVDEYMVLFGGYGGLNHNSILGDTWVFEQTGTHIGVWFNETAYLGSSAPAPRANEGMTWDQRDGEIVLFGGGNSTALFGDTWVFKGLGVKWSEPVVCGGPGQSACSSPTPNPLAAMVFTYDVLDQAIVMTGGFGQCTGTTAFGGCIASGTYFYQGGNWSACTGYICTAYYYGISTFIAAGAGTYDAADGYTVTVGGLAWFVNQADYYGFYYWDPYSWAFGPTIQSEGPGFSPDFIDLGESVTFNVGLSGGGIGSYQFDWEGLPPGCAPPSPQVVSFSCAVDYPGFVQLGSSPVYGSYYDPAVGVTDTSGFPGIVTPEADHWLNRLWVAPDPLANVNSSATVADVGQTVYFGLTGINGWTPYTFYWDDLPPGCSVANTTEYTQLVKCVLGTNALGNWLPYAHLYDSTGFNVISASLSLTVDPAPTSTGVVVNTDHLDAGQTLAVSVGLAGGSGGYTFDWSSVPPSCLANAALLTCSVPLTEVGSYDPTVTIHDSAGATVTESYSGTVVVSSDPTATGLSVKNASNDPVSYLDVGQSITFSLTTTAGSGGDTIVWTGLPTGCTSSGPAATSVSCSPTGTGTYSVSATVNDSNDVSATSPTVTLSISPALSGGVVADSVSAVDIGGSLTVVATVVGGSGSNSYAWTGLPTGCVAPDSAVVSCVPTGPGSSTPSVTVRDSAGGSLLFASTAAVVVSPDPTATALTVTNAAGGAVGTVVSGTSVTFTLTSTAGSGGDTVAWLGLPAGCTPSGAGATSVSCASTSPGSYSVSARVTDSNGVSSTSPVVDLTITAAPAPAASTPFATSFEWLELGLLLGVIVLLLALVVVALRRPPRGGSEGGPSTRAEPAATPTTVPAPATGPSEDYRET